MGWFTDLFTSGFAKVVDSVGGVIDNLHTSDDEKLAAKQKLTEEMNRFQAIMLEAQAQYDKQITERLKSDNQHWMTRLIRPLSMAVMLGLFVVVVLMDGNIGRFSINPDYIPVIETLLQTMIVFYFGARTIDKGVTYFKKK